MKRNNNKNKGFSLVETIIYLAIVGILLTATISLHLTLGGTTDKLASNIATSRNRRVAMGSIDYLVKNSDGLLKDVFGDCSDFGSSPESLALYFEDDSYLPGTCVGTGGGLRISIDDKKIVATCYPNMSGNGYYQNCDTSIYPADNVYYLTSSDVAVLDSSLDFSTSTASSTANSFLSLTTNLSVGTHSNNQIRLRATSTATSTSVIRNEQNSGLVTWWRMNEGTSDILADSAGSNDGQCYGTLPTWTTGIASSSPYALDFEYSTGASTCIPYDPIADDVYNPDDLNFDDQFTISAWVKPEALNGSANHSIINKSDITYNKGYEMRIMSTGAKANCRIYNGETYFDVDSPDSDITAGNLYHIACVYDNDSNRFQLYVYESGTGVLSSTTYSGTVPILVNDYMEPHISYPGYGTSPAGNFDGIMDEVRFYNRALSDEEIYALHSQGAY
jgi:type II secretory pathway pseudopilin PulG